MASIFSQFLVIHPPGRKQEIMAVLLETLLLNEKVKVVDNLFEGLAGLQKEGPALVMVGCSLPGKEMENYLLEIHRRNPRARVLLLLPHPQENNPYKDIEADGILYDGFSPQLLIEMLERLSGLDG